MGQQHQQIDSIGREQNEGFAASGQVLMGNYIYEEIISPNSLLRSDRFARAKPIAGAGQVDETARVWKQPSSRQNRSNNYSGGERRVTSSRRNEAASITHRRDTATTSTDLGFSEIRKRGKAPARVRPATAATNSKVYSFGQQRDGKRNGENHLPNIGARLSQPPLRPASRYLTTGRFQQSPMRSKPVTAGVSPDIMAMKVSELEPSSEMDTWTSRCCNLTQQIVDHLRRWNQAFSDG